LCGWREREGRRRKGTKESKAGKGLKGMGRKKLEGNMGLFKEAPVVVPLIA